MNNIVLYDIDSRIPNLALMKFSRFYKDRGYRVLLTKEIKRLPAYRYFASAVFNTEHSVKKVARLKKMYGDNITLGGTGVNLTKNLDAEVESCFPDYTLYAHTQYALGFLTRGCNKRCSFCVVPKKEGRLKPDYACFDDFVPQGQRNIMLLDNNLLAAPNVHDLLDEMIRRQFNINFSQTLDIQYLTDEIYPALKKVHSMNSRFTRKMIYFSCNTVKQAQWFIHKSDMLKGFGREQVTALIMFGFNTRLSQDFSLLKIMKRLGVTVFLQQYRAIEGVPARIPENYFDMDLDEVAAFTFRTNGRNNEKFFRFVNQLYFNRYGRYYLPLLQAIYRYNNKQKLQTYLKHPELLSVEMYTEYPARRQTICKESNA